MTLAKILARTLRTEKMARFDDYVSHMAEVEFYATGRQKRIARSLRGLFKSMEDIYSRAGKMSAKERVRKFNRDCDRVVDAFVESTIGKESKTRKAFARKESAFLGGSLTVNQTAKILDAPFGRWTSFEDFVTYIGDRLKRSVHTASANAYIFGGYVGTFSEPGRIIREAETEMHMSVTAEQRTVQRFVMPGGRKLRFRYVSMLDDRTCIECGALSGKVYKSLDDAPTLPRHERCRCFYYPMIGEDEPKEDSFAGWLERQPESTQRKVLGPSRYALYRAGVTITQFSPDGHALTLKELYESDSLKKRE